MAAASLFTTPSRALNANGNTLPGAVWYFYQTGTSTPLAVYADASLSTSLGSSVEADSGGLFPSIYLDDTVAYRAVLKTAAGVELEEHDPANPSGQIIRVATIADLTALRKSRLTNAQIVEVTHYADPFDGGGGTFYWHATAPTTPDGGTVFASDEGGNGRWFRDFKGAVSPTWFGAKGDGQTDDTEAFQACLDGLVNLAVTVPYARYEVSHIDLDLLGHIYDGGGALIQGNATTPQTSLVGMRGGLSYYRDLRVIVFNNANYECALHWYTNRLDQPERNYPGYLDAVNIQVDSAEIGLMIGALPSQTVIGEQDDILDDGEAIDAPLSEALITGFKATGCAIGAYMRQPNGKVNLIGPRLLSETDGWIGGYPTPERTAAVVVAHEGSELSVVGGEMLHVQGGDNGSLFTVTAGRLNAIGTVVETTVPAFIDGHSYVYLDHIQNFGVNLVNPNRPLFEIGPDFDGTLSVANCRVLYPAGNAGSNNGELAKSVSSLGGSFAPSPATIVNFENCEFRDAVWRMGSTYRPIVRGVRVSFIQCQLTAYNLAGDRTLLLRIEDGPNLLAGVVDRTFKTLPTSAQTSGATDGGFTFTVSGTGSEWNADTSGLPDIEDLDAYAWLRLKAGGTGTTTAETAKFRCKPSKPHIVRGVIKTGTSTATLIIRAKYFDFDGSAASTASFDMFNGQQLEFGSSVQPVIFYFVPPADADQCSLYFEVRNGAECFITLPEVG